MRHLHHRLWAVITDFDSEPVEFFSALIMFTLGMWMAFVNIFAVSSAFAWMATHGQRRGWGEFLAVTGFAQVFAVASGSERLRTISATFSLGVWVFFAIMLYLGDSRSAGPLIFGIYALSQLWALFRI